MGTMTLTPRPSAAADVSWQNPRVMVALMAVFLMGAAFGGVVMKFTLGAKVAAQSAPTWKAEDRKQVFQLFQKELNLTQEQSGQLEIVLDDFSMYIQNLQAQYEEVRASGRDRIMRILTPEQQEKFKKLVTQLPGRPLR